MSIKKTSAILHDTHDIHVKQFHYWNEFPLNNKIDTRKIYSSAQFPELNTDLLAIHFFSKIQELIILLAWIIKSLFCTSNPLGKKRGFWGGLMYMAFNLLNILCKRGFVCVCRRLYGCTMMMCIHRWLLIPSSWWIQPWIANGFFFYLSTYIPFSSHHRLFYFLSFLFFDCIAGAMVKRVP